MEWAFVEIMKRLIQNYKEVTEVLKGNIKSTIGQNVDEELRSILDKIEENQNQMLGLLRQKRNGEISLEQYNERGADIEQAIQELTRKELRSRKIIVKQTRHVEGGANQCGIKCARGHRKIRR